MTNAQRYLLGALAGGTPFLLATAWSLVGAAILPAEVSAYAIGIPILFFGAVGPFMGTAVGARLLGLPYREVPRLAPALGSWVGSLLALNPAFVRIDVRSESAPSPSGLALGIGIAVLGGIVGACVGAFASRKGRRDSQGAGSPKA